jgi:hypothetical protein
MRKTLKAGGPCLFFFFFLNYSTTISDVRADFTPEKVMTSDLLNFKPKTNKHKPGSSL